jgi:uncharacterized protein
LDRHAFLEISLSRPAFTLARGSLAGLVAAAVLLGFTVTDTASAWGAPPRAKQTKKAQPVKRPKVRTEAELAKDAAKRSWGWRRKLIYQPSKVTPPPAAVVIPGGQDVTVSTSDGLRLGAYWVPPRNPGRDATVLVAGGSNGQRGEHAELARTLARRGLGVLVFDYRGYGGNAGVPSEAGLALDARAARRFLVETKRVRPDRLLHFGYSMGTAVLTELAAAHPPAGLVLASPFLSLASGGRHMVPWYLPMGPLMRQINERFQLRRHLRSVLAPTVVVLGTEDRNILPAHSRRVADEAPGLVEPPIEIPGADHSDTRLRLDPKVIDAVVRLAAQADGASRSTSGD